MKTLDTTTVLEIIKMIDANLDKGSNLILQSLPLSENKQHYYMGWKEALTLLQGNLQDYIEGQLNAAENQSTE